ncbi:MAG TPA: NUDIX domain-containing protein [Thermomicrobiales bacterium]|mgnify:CR=1 FL=1|nr:NUDIX domain-containing protein [Thermomicrobiales bacterium]
MIERDWGVAVLVVRDQQILLHWHAKLHRWLPPGGHIEPNELPDEAAVREVHEETGVAIKLVGPHPHQVMQHGQPQPLIRPLGIQLATIRPDHQHIDLVYLAEGLTAGDSRGTWFTHDDCAGLDLTDEVRAWIDTAFAALPLA